MSKAYLVHVRSASGVYAETLQVLAASPEQAAATVKSTVEPGSHVEAEREPLSVERAKEAGIMNGSPRPN